MREAIRSAATVATIASMIAVTVLLLNRDTAVINVTDEPTVYATTNVEEIGTPTARPSNWRELPEYRVNH